MPNPQHTDTDQLRDWSQLRKQLADECVRTEDGCLLFPTSSITARCSGGVVKGVSPARVAWALANPQDHLGPYDLAVHICGFGTNHGNGAGDPRVCCEPTHIKKGSVTDVVIMQQARRRGLVLQGGSQ